MGIGIEGCSFISVGIIQTSAVIYPLSNISRFIYYLIWKEISSLGVSQKRQIFTDVMGSGEESTTAKPSKPTSTQVFLRFALCICLLSKCLCTHDFLWLTFTSCLFFPSIYRRCQLRLYILIGQTLFRFDNGAYFC